MINGQLTVLPVPGIPFINSGDDLADIIYTSLNANDLALENGDVLVLAQKIVSKAEGRTVRLSEVVASAEAIELARQTDKEPTIVQLILNESRQILRHRPGVLIAEHNLGIVLANAGIDRSNVDADEDIVLLLPEAPDASAAELRNSLQQRAGIQLGIIIADSVGRAWRMGTTGMTLGCAGVEALANLRGQKDLFARELQVSEHAIADSIAAAAELVMGEADEAIPVVIVRGLKQGYADMDSTPLLRPAHEDMFR
jgi:coenzyme F420-0:L-glutamate ligase/coenzyme F420-1:gamma-L-glutamate ligase